MERTPRGLAASLFNVSASIVLVAIASVVMVRLIRTDPDSSATFAPFYVLLLCLIGGFLFSGREGRWVTAKILLQALSIFVILPLAIMFYGTYWMNTAIELDQLSHHPYVASSLDTNRPSIHE
jgi:hypothetical protein